ncbi:uncharacterized protein J3R85_012502 [Psidium guajava]|nr:uncharacterized protein J3R85_012502 [Psidium guajava]
MVLTNLSMALTLDPSSSSLPFVAASLICRVAALALFLSSPPFPSFSITNSITRVTTSASILLSNPHVSSTHTPVSSTIVLALYGCSAPLGHPTNGTPWLKLSVIEFHPQCLRNAPVEPCDSTPANLACPWSFGPRTLAAITRVGNCL